MNGKRCRANREPGMNLTDEVCPFAARSPGAGKYHQLSLLITSYHPNVKNGSRIHTENKDFLRSAFVIGESSPAQGR
jgi:hypothetical protein